MAQSTVSKRFFMLVALAVLAAICAAMVLVAPPKAYAADAQADKALAAGELQPQATTRVVKKTLSFTWIKSGKELYQWSGYSKAKKNGTMKMREAATSYFAINDSIDRIVSVSTPKSSNSAIIAAKPITKFWYMKYNLKKAGTATITYSIKYVRTSGTVVIVKFTEKHRIARYANPLSVLKVGSVDYAGKLASTPQYVTKKAIMGKVVAKAAKGWKLIKIRRVNSSVASGESIPQKQVKNGTNVHIKKSDKSALEVICYNTAKKYYESVILSPSFTYSIIYG